MTSKLKTGLLTREFAVERSAVDEENRSVALAFSSELPVERYFGMEVLDHDEKSIRMGRLRDGGPVLVDHDPRDHVGVVEDVSVGPDRVARAVVRFGQSNRAREIFQDIVDGIRSKVSVGYVIHKANVEGKDAKVKTFRAVDWEPLEVSIVAVPADASVGIGRNRPEDVEHETIVVEDSQAPESHEQEQQQQRNIQMSEQNNGAPTAVDAEAIVRETRAKEMSRIADLEKLGNQYAQFDGVALARKCISEGSSVADFQRQVLENVNKKGDKAPNLEVGLTKREAQNFSFVRVINALANPTDRKAQEAAAFEFEASRAAAEKYGREARGIMLPYEVMTRADLTTSTSGTEKAGYLVPTDHMSFIDALRNKMVVQAAGARFMTGLQGNVAIPKLSTATVAYWVAENSAPTEGAPVFAQVTMSPKTIGAYVDFSRRLMLQASPDVEGIVRGDLSTGLAVGIDAAAIASGGTNKPTGVLGTSGIGSVTLGTNGGAPTWAMCVNLVKEVEVDNALMGSCAYITNPKVVAKLRQTARQASGVEGNFIMGDRNELLGYPVLVSNQVPANLSKGSASGTLSAMLFGNWSDLMIGMWGGIDLTVDPYTGSSAGTVRVVALADVDVAVRHAESFAECNEILPT